MPIPPQHLAASRSRSGTRQVIKQLLVRARRGACSFRVGIWHILNLHSGFFQHCSSTILDQEDESRATQRLTRPKCCVSITFYQIFYSGTSFCQQLASMRNMYVRDTHRAFGSREGKELRRIS
jgi:hypothetical protein